MAYAPLPPHLAAQQNKQADLARRLNSVDPVERYRAQEEVISGQQAAFGKAFAAKAKQTAEAYQAEIRRCEEADRRLNPYKPLPKGAKVTKSY